MNSAHGINSRLNSSFGACNDSASVTGSSSSAANFSIALCIPTVEIVMRRAPIPMPHSAASVRTAATTGRKFASGSPIPMNTTLLIRSTPSSRFSLHTCSTIRPADKFPSSPPSPLAQNRHPTGHPTWLDMHAVFRFGDGSLSVGNAGIITHSVCRAVAEYGIAPPTIGNRSSGLISASPAGIAPRTSSGHSISNFCVPSVAIWCATLTPDKNTISCASISRSRAARLLISRGSTTPLRYTQSRICAARNRGIPLSPHHADKVSGVNSNTCPSGCFTHKPTRPHRHMKIRPSPPTVPMMHDQSWLIEQPNFNPETFKAYEGLFTLGSPALHLRGSLEQLIHNHPQDTLYERRAANVTSEKFRHNVTKLGTYVPTVYADHPTLNAQLVNLPSPLGLDVCCNNNTLHPGSPAISRDTRTLDLRHALLTRHTHWHIGQTQLRLTFERFVSRTRPGLIAQRLSIESDHPIDLQLAATIDARVTTNGYDHFSALDWTTTTNPSNATTLALNLTLDSGQSVHYTSELRTQAQPTRAGAVDRLGSITADIHVAPDQPAVIEKLTIIHASSTPHPAPARDTLDTSFDDLFSEHAAAWAEAWNTCDVHIEGDPHAQQAARAALFHLLRTHPHTDAAAIDAKGYAGEAYWGRFFWDTEMYLLPFFLYTQPQHARDLVMFRVRTLPGARHNATRKGQPGARFAWESDCKGIECCPNWQYADHEIHVTADVVFGFQHYALAAADDDFLNTHARDTILDVARYFLDRVDFRAGDNRPHLLGVMGPDEYTPISSNNAFTNRLVSRALTQAAAAAAQHTPPDLDAQHLHSIATQLPIPSDGDLILQCDEWPLLAQPHFDTSWPDRSRTFASQVPQEKLYRTRCLKQADVLMLMALLPHEFTDAQVLAAWNEYLPCTTHDSSLSAGAHMLVASRLGLADHAWNFWNMGSRLDLDVEHGGAAEGIHIAGAGAIWQMIVLGFAGLKTAIETTSLTFTPRLPKHWTRLRFPLAWRNTRVMVDLDHAALSLQHLAGPALSITVHAKQHTLTPGQTHTWRS